MTHAEVVKLARSKIDGCKGSAMWSSAVVCVCDAEALIATGKFGDDRDARNRAIKSLCYSVGVFSEDYRRAIA